MKIPANIEPTAHISPYRRIDPEHPSRKRIITFDEWTASGATREPVTQPSTAMTSAPDRSPQARWRTLAGDEHPSE